MLISAVKNTLLLFSIPHSVFTKAKEQVINITERLIQNIYARELKGLKTVSLFPLGQIIKIQQFNY